MQIKNFVHDVESSRITFDVIKDGDTHEIEIKDTEYGASSTNYELFTEHWSDGEYSQLEDFINACSGLVHRY